MNYLKYTNNILADFFNSPEHKVLKVSYCDHYLFVVCMSLVKHATTMFYFAVISFNPYSAYHQHARLSCTKWLSELKPEILVKSRSPESNQTKIKR